MIFERYFIDVMKGKRTGLLPSLAKGILWLLSIPYRMVISTMNWAFDKELLRQYNPPIPIVVSIGNIVVGGTGKTPVTLMLANELYDEAVLGILTRGYRSPAENLPSPVTLSTGSGPLHSAAYCGDEPYLLSENLPKAYIYVGKDRQKTAVLAAKAGVQLAILDDGMQHRRIGRDYEIVVMDVDDPLGQNHLLPRGFLRESPKCLSRANLIILNHSSDKEKFEACKKIVEKYTNASIVGTTLHFDKFYDLKRNEILNLKDKKGVIFCGIGQPERFIQSVKNCGVQVIGQELFVDHTPYYAEDLIRMADKYKAQGAEMLLCTEKDKVKIPEIPGLSLPIVWMKVKMKVVENEQVWKDFVNKLRLDLGLRSKKESL